MTTCFVIFVWVGLGMYTTLGYLLTQEFIKNLTTDKILDGNEVQIQDKNILLLLIGDFAYPLRKFLMKPFTFNFSLTNDLSKAHTVVENAFRRLKARWRWLTKRNMNVSNVPNVVAACCILHNVYEMFGDRIHDTWLDDACDATDQPLPISTRDRAESDAKEIRNTLVQYYNEN